ncbi:hypothetical protein C8R44DRAFT_987360 [Mycena epipterygia]|nr:hypothetical protein C8R44DRAFT_987360 [Mycena epipterygia]
MIASFGPNSASRSCFANAMTCLHYSRAPWSRFRPWEFQQQGQLYTSLLPLQQAMEIDKLVVGRAITVKFRLLVEHSRHLSDLRCIPAIVLGEDNVQQQFLRLFSGSPASETPPCSQPPRDDPNSVFLATEYSFFCTRYWGNTAFVHEDQDCSVCVAAFPTIGLPFTA